MGRDFTGADTLKTPKVAIVNQSFVPKFNLGSTAIAKHSFGSIFPQTIGRRSSRFSVRCDDALQYFP
jgi:hypothetical protein